MTRHMAVFCDESGTHDCDYFGWGSVWCPRRRIDELDEALDRILYGVGKRGELKWTDGAHPAALDSIVDWFFETPWICFQSLLVREETMQIFEGGNSRAVAFKKLLCTMLATQIERFDRLPGGPRTFSVFVDESGDTTRSMTRREFEILAATTQKWLDSDRELVRNFRRIDSRSRRGIQLADLFIGALRASWEGSPTGTKGEVCRHVAHKLGWTDLRGTTPPNLKFNVWMHRDSREASPHVDSRRVRLQDRCGDPERIFDRLESTT